MGFFNNQMHKQMKKEAYRLSVEVTKSYKEIKENNPTMSELDIIIRIFFDPALFDKLSGEAKEKALICCSTINGICYMIALNHGRMKNLINLRSIQFTIYMDIELEKQGFPVQTKKQKELILDALDLKINNWDTIKI